MPTTQSPTSAIRCKIFTRPMNSSTMQTATRMTAVERFSEKINAAVTRMGSASLMRKSLNL